MSFLYEVNHIKSMQGLDQVRIHQLISMFLNEFERNVESRRKTISMSGLISNRLSIKELTENLV